MADDKTTASRPVEPIQVPIIGTGDASKLPSGTLAITPGAHQPDVVTHVVQPFVAIMIRFANAYLTMLVGLVSAGMATDIIPAADFLHLVASCAKLSLAGAGLGMLKDFVTVFGKLEQKYPLQTGNI